MPTAAEKTNIPTLRICDYKIARYHHILSLQHQLHEKRLKNQIPDTVLILEHYPVITLGARKSDNKLLADPAELGEKGIDLVSIRRGGGVTAHNPGQLVFYPIINIKERDLGITEYVRKLEQIGIELLQHFGLNPERRKKLPGLWLDSKKIASIGVRVSKSITCHGMAINIKNNLEIFKNIIPCGIDGVEITSLRKETQKTYSMTRVKKTLAELLIKHFSTSAQTRKLPPWLKRPLPAGEKYKKTEKILASLSIETICSNANCPNRGQCFQRGTATALILGNLCTRNCKFCSVASGKPAPPDPTEPDRLVQMAKKLQLKYLVITSVSRDDLPDGGAAHFRDCICKVRQKCPDIEFEILTPDFRSCQSHAVEILAEALPFVFSHNIETVPSLYPITRPTADYQTSLNLLKLTKKSYKKVQTKSFLMLGLGETDTQIEQALIDLRNVGCDRISIGQYLKPSKDSLDVVEYVTPEKFDYWKQKAQQLGFSWAMSSPFTRSSYFAELQNTSKH